MNKNIFPIYEIYRPKNDIIPVLISIPHSGVYFPEYIKKNIKPEILNYPEDTDWFVEKLFVNAAVNCGITVIKAKYSRYIIDLNRSLNENKIYNDNRLQTGLIPVTTFHEKPIYMNKYILDDNEKKYRIETFYLPYYEAIKSIINKFKTTHDKNNIILIDAHSIKRSIPSISINPFPDITISNRNFVTCENKILNNLKKYFLLDFIKNIEFSPIDISYNYPFIGGNITNVFSDISNKIHTLQIEISQDIYMNDFPPTYAVEKANSLINRLKSFFQYLQTKYFKDI
jgi:N-formylglutamate deformylase